MALRSVGLNPSRDDNDISRAAVTDFINLRVAEGWRHGFWNEWLTVEKRRYRPVWTATSYTASTALVPTEAFFLPARAYVQCIAAALGTDLPYTLVGGVYTLNSAHWAASANEYGEVDDWITGTSYIVGDQVRNPNDDNQYVCHTSHTAGATFGSANFGILTPWSKTVSRTQTGATVIETLKSAYAKDPRIYPCQQPLAATHGPTAILFESDAPSDLWLEFRAPPPQFSAVNWSATEANVAGDIRYRATTGQCYLALAGSTGSIPESTPASWSVVQFPLRLVNFVARAAGADLLRDSKQSTRARDAEAAAYGQLASAWDHDQGQQGTEQTVGVVTWQ
jgi:hypothetical protein